MNRKEFIKQSCGLCAALASSGIVLQSLQGCASSSAIVKTKSQNNLIRIDKAALDSSKNFYQLRDAELEYDVLLIKEKERGYKALYMQCTHESNPVYFNGSQIYCNSHGSRFDTQGEVLTGPAAQPLRQFKVSEENNFVVIHI